MGAVARRLLRDLRCRVRGVPAHPQHQAAACRDRAPDGRGRRTPSHGLARPWRSTRSWEPPRGVPRSRGSFRGTGTRCSSSSAARRRCERWGQGAESRASPRWSCRRRSGHVCPARSRPPSQAWWSPSPRNPYGIAGAISRSVPVLSAAKGLEHGSRARMSEVFAACGWSPRLGAALSGPNLAHEVARGLPAAAVVACPEETLARRWQEALSGSRFRVYRSTDVVGVEVAGALKNVIAIAAGAAAGLGFGANTMATILTRGLAEMTRLGVALGADPLTFQGLAGVGDLAATCFSPLSRNRRLGELVAGGLSPSAAQDEIGEVVEGISTAPVAVDLGRAHGVELPIAEQVAEALAGRVSVLGALAELLGRSLKPEASGRGAVLD
ncbi:NAD(P)H-dependent glycerol-3-phosphate dehydrogenase [bacterium]|nr:MAG: NAD(P)H-dependent glycerol-3-phosphate dehydrogenase [bacterium]